MSDAASPASAADPPTSPELAAALEKAEKYKQKLHGAVKKGKSIESERDALREQLDAAVRDLATANTKLKVMREMEAVSVEAAAAAADEPSAAARRAAALEADLAETRAELEASEEALRSARRGAARAEAEKDALVEALDASRAALEASRRGEAGAIVAVARAEDAEKRAADLAADLAAQRAARAAAEEAAAAARAAAEEARLELASLGDGARAERASAETARRDADAERRAATEARDAAEASAAESEARAARAEARAADAEAELESLSEAAEARRARFEHAQTLHFEREEALRRELEEARRNVALGGRGGGAAEGASDEASSGGSARRRAEAAEAENARLRAALDAAEASGGDRDDRAGEEPGDGERRALDALRRRVAVAEAAAAVAREEASESRRGTAAELAEARREAAARVDEAEASAARDRRGYETAMEENARLRHAASRSASGGDGGAAYERRAAAAEANVARLRATVASLEAENKSLQWQVAADVSAGDGRKPPSFPLRAGETGAETVGTAGLSPPLFERVLRDKTHRRAVVIGYLAVLHLLVYFSVVHGTFSRGGRAGCVSGIVARGTTGA